MLHSAVLNVMIKAARRAGRSLKRDLGEAGDGAELDIPIDLGVDAVQLAGLIERAEPAAQIAEGLRIAVNGHRFVHRFGRESCQIFCHPAPR